MVELEDTRAAVLGPKTPTLSLVCALKLLDLVALQLLMFLDVGKLTSKQLVRDKSDTLCQHLVLHFASNDLRIRNDKHGHISIELLDLLDSMVQGISHTYFQNA